MRPAGRPGATVGSLFSPNGTTRAAGWLSVFRKDCCSGAAAGLTSLVASWCSRDRRRLDERERIKIAFNAPFEDEPVRILVCTDAAREGLNLQARCHDLVHFDLPWNPSRLEQRNGRIDRKLQPSPVVTCRYFVYAQREEDRVLDALMRKTETIRRELGASGEVLRQRIERKLSREGIRRGEAGKLAAEIAGESVARRLTGRARTR